MSKPSSATDAHLVQLKRIRGQVDGIITMYQEERGCIDICHQIVAVRGSLERIARDLLTGEAGRCSREARTEEFDKVLKELFKYE